MRRGVGGEKQLKACRMASRGRVRDRAQPVGARRTIWPSALFKQLLYHMRVAVLGGDR